MLKYEIRSAEERDVQAIADIYNEAVIRGGASADLEPVSLEARRAWVDSHNPRTKYPVIVIDVTDPTTGERATAGFGSLSKFHQRAGYDGIAELSYYIAGRFHGQGLGTAMVDWLLAAARERGFRHVATIIYADNAGSVAIMRKFGFTRFGLLPAAVATAGSDALHDMSYWYRVL
ncbi:MULTISPECIES: GNAT family N-acetyltransferase [Bifidobacterium]|uniref:GNAT family N-acetyltransferase n=1 Tax=Bifidobacterium TaxID=1678 RepID=UPI001BDCB2CA|nr:MULTISPECIES: GNAT family N-acetyltransferase [Bifidobacterium]MBT1162441.1 N-acetyltransferase [Bifidobacterium sp. SO1]MBW3078292.1 N-acetyltransferase [Bifidobacterium simiiventris]